MPPSLTNALGGNNVPVGAPAQAKVPPMFPWPLGSLIVPPKGYGLGNPITTLDRDQAMPFRDQVGLFVFDNAAGVLTLAANSFVDYFAAGESEDVPASNGFAGITASFADTNLFPGGAPVPRDSLFAAVSIGVTIGRPFILAAVGVGREYPEWLSESKTAGQSYAEMAREILFDSLALEVRYQDATQNFPLGALSHYPDAAGTYGPNVTRINGGFGVMSMLPILRGPVYLGASDEVNQATLRVTSIKQDLILSAQTVVATKDVFVPVRLTAYGDSGPWCGPCAPSAEDIDALVAARVDAALARLGR